MVVNNEEEVPVLVSPLSIVMDVRLSDRDYFLLRELYSHLDTSSNYCITVVLQHLLGTYSFTLGNEALLYAALSYGSWCVAFERKKTDLHLASEQIALRS